MELQDFLRLADETLEEIAGRLEEFDPDECDFECGDGMLTLEFADGSKFVLNRQRGNHQMWLAAGARAWHYDWDPESRCWKDDRDGHELRTRLSEVVGEKLGRKISI